jgi:hypothetical protein
MYCRVKQFSTNVSEVRAASIITLMMEAARTSETSVDNNFTRQYIPEDKSELHTRRRENLKSHSIKLFSRQFLNFIRYSPDTDSLSLGWSIMITASDSGCSGYNHSPEDPCFIFLLIIGLMLKANISNCVYTVLCCSPQRKQSGLHVR